jgi:hypothetical protein
MLEIEQPRSYTYTVEFASGTLAGIGFMLNNLREWEKNFGL